MITAPAYQGKTIGVFGLARTGQAAVQALVASGATVWAWDDNPKSVENVGAVAVDLYQADFKDLDALMVAPGVPLTFPKPHDLVVKAMAAEVPVIGDMDIFEAARESLIAHKVVAITGTNGKSTTSALIAHILKNAGVPTALGGNIGTGVLSLDALLDGGVYVFEVSSYQIDLMHHFTPDIAVLMNITPDHLDRHGSMEGYVAAKARLFDLLSEVGLAVIVEKDAYCRRIAAEVRQETAQLRTDIDMSACPTLSGPHNADNAAVAHVVCSSLGLSDEQIIAGLRSFPGLAHRLEHVATIDGVLYVNDSKATNVDAAATGIRSFTNIHWIGGGIAKEKGLDGLIPLIDRIKHAYLVGEAMEDFATSLDGRVAFDRSETLENAVKTAYRNAEEGDVVLLSPACAAFDQYQNFEVRGNTFKALVKELGARDV